MAKGRKGPSSIKLITSFIFFSSDKGSLKNVETSESSSFEIQDAVNLFLIDIRRSTSSTYPPICIDITPYFTVS